jgi:four helix bundle protein
MGYRDLAAWKSAMDLVDDVYRLTKGVPAAERFRLTAQMRRAPVSIPANIAAGQGRRTSGAFANHALTARGSLLELETQILIASRLGYFASTSSELALSRCEELIRVRRALARAASDKAPGSPVPTPG